MTKIEFKTRLIILLPIISKIACQVLTSFKIYTKKKKKFKTNWSKTIKITLNVKDACNLNY